MDYFTKKVLLNHQIFMEKLLANSDFFLEIIAWKYKLQITDNDLGDFFAVKKEVYVQAHEFGNQLLEKIRTTKNEAFLRWLDSFCIKNQLGSIWKRPILDYIACGYYCPPETSVDINLNKERNSIILELNADTTKEDFEKAWIQIRKKLKELPNNQSRKLSNKSFRNLEKILKANEIRDKEGLKGLDLIGRLYENAEDISELTDKKRKHNLKIAQQRLKRRGYKK
jgi:hypothetical protein